MFEGLESGRTQIDLSIYLSIYRISSCGCSSCAPPRTRPTFEPSCRPPSQFGAAVWVVVKEAGRRSWRHYHPQPNFVADSSLRRAGGGEGDGGGEGAPAPRIPRPKAQSRHVFKAEYIITVYPPRIPQPQTCHHIPDHGTQDPQGAYPYTPHLYDGHVMMITSPIP